MTHDPYERFADRFVLTMRDLFLQIQVALQRLKAAEQPPLSPQERWESIAFAMGRASLALPESVRPGIELQLLNHRPKKPEDLNAALVVSAFRHAALLPSPDQAPPTPSPEALRQAPHFDQFAVVGLSSSQAFATRINALGRQMYSDISATPGPSPTVEQAFLRIADAVGRLFREIPDAKETDYIANGLLLFAADCGYPDRGALLTRLTLAQRAGRAPGLRMGGALTPRQTL